MKRPMRRLLPKRPRRPSAADRLNAFARAEHEAREVVRRQRRRGAKHWPTRVDAYDWPADTAADIARGVA